MAARHIAPDVTGGVVVAEILDRGPSIGAPPHNPERARRANGVFLAARPPQRSPHPFRESPGGSPGWLRTAGIVCGAGVSLVQLRAREKALTISTVSHMTGPETVP